MTLSLEKEEVIDGKNIKIKPTIKGPTKIVIMLILLTISGIGTYSVLNHKKSGKDAYNLPNVPISKPVEETTPEVVETPNSDSDLVDGEHQSTKVSDLKKLIDELTKQTNNQFYSRRNYYLRKATEAVDKGGKSLEYYLLIELNRIRDELKNEILQNNSKSVAGIGGEYTGSATDSEKARALLGDATALALAFDYLGQIPDEARPDPDALVSRVSIGKLIQNILDFELSARRDLQAETWEVIDRANNQIEMEKNLKQDTQILKDQLKDVK